MTSLHWTWRIQHKIICNLICFSPPCFFHYSSEHLMERLTLPDVPSYCMVEVGWVGVAWVELLVAKRPMMSQQGGQDTCLVSGSEQQACMKGRRGLTSGACFQWCLGGLAGLELCQCRVVTAKDQWLPCWDSSRKEMAHWNGSLKRMRWKEFLWAALRKSDKDEEAPAWYIVTWRVPSG